MATTANTNGQLELLEPDDQARQRVKRALAGYLAGYTGSTLDAYRLEHNPAANVRRPKLDYTSTTLGLDRHELGAFLAQAGSAAVPPGQRPAGSHLAEREKCRYGRVERGVLSAAAGLRTARGWSTGGGPTASPLVRAVDAEQVSGVRVPDPGERTSAPLGGARQAAPCRL